MAENEASTSAAPQQAPPPAPARRSPHPRRRRLTLALLALLALYVWVQLPAWSAQALQGQLGRFFHRPVSVGAVRYRIFPFEAEILDLRVGGASPKEAPFLEVPRVRLVPSLQSLFSRQVVLRLLRLERPRVRVHAYKQGGDDIPKMGGEGKGGLDLRIRRLVVEQGEFLLDHERVPLQIDVPDFQGRLANQGGKLLSGRVSFGPGTLQFGQNPVLGVSSDLQMTLDGSLLSVSDGHLRARGTDLAYTGQLRLRGRPTGEFQLRGRVDLQMLDQHMMRTGFRIEGDGFYDGSMQVEGSRLNLNGRLYGTAGRFDGVPVPRYDGRISWDQRGVILSGLQVETLEGSGTLDLELPPRPKPARLRATLAGIDAESLWRAVFDWGETGLGGAASGQLALEWPRGHIRQLSGRIDLEVQARADGRRPLSGRLAWRAESGRQFVELADLKTTGTHLRIEGRVEPDDRTDLALEADSSDLADSDELFRRLRLALGNGEAQRAGFSGAGSFRGRWLGSLKEPVYAGRASASELSYLGVSWGRAEWAGVADSYRVRSHSLVLHSPGGELWLDGMVETGEYGRADGLDLSVRLRDWPAADFVRAYQWDLDLTGLISGSARLQGRRSRPTGELRMSVGEGRYYGVPFSEAALEARLKGTWTELPSGRAKLGGGEIAFRGSATLDGIYDGHVELKAVDIAQLLPPLAPDVRWGGRVSGEVTLAGPLELARLQARISSPRLFLGDEGLGALEASLRGLGDGNVSVDARVRSARVEATLLGTLQAAPPYTAALRLSLVRTSVDPFLRALVPELPGTLGLVTSGELQIDGPLEQPRELKLSATVPEFAVLLPEHALHNTRALRVTVEGGRLVARDVELGGDGTDLRLEGSGALFGEGPLEFELQGAADLKTLSAVTRRLRGQGAARLSVKFQGTRQAPHVAGRLELEGGGLRVRGFPHGVEDVHGTVEFSEHAASFSDLRGSVGGGPLELRGQLAYGGGRLRSFDVQAVGRSLALRYPEGLRSVLDGELRIFGDAQNQWVTGSVDVRQALWNKRYELASELLSSGRAAARPESALGGGLRYDVKLRVPGTLRVDNNLAALVARAELQLSGSYDQPVVLGRAEIERGRIYFQGNTYVIRRGTLDFADARKIDPLFDIEAETRVRSYRVTLRVSGTLERVYPTLTSDTPLSAVQILNLLAGADEATVNSLTLSQTDQARLAAAGAATLAAGKLSEDLGLERGAERLFGLSRFSIDPSVVRGGLANPTARLSVGKRITPDLSVLYSLDLRSAEDRVLTIEYTLSDRLSLLLTQAQPGGLGFDVRLRQTR